MHTLGMIILWTALQVTVIAAVIFLVLPFTKKSDPLWRTQILLGGIAAVIFVTLCSVSPWPNWSRMWDADQTAMEGTKLKEKDEALASPAPVVETETTAPNESPMTKWSDEEQPVSVWSAAWTEFLDQVKQPHPIALEQTQEVPLKEKPSFTVGTVIGILFLLGVGFSLFRLMAGIWLLRREILRSPVIEEEHITRMIRSILGETSKVPPIKIRISRQLQTAATTGIFRPVILLPTCWETWSDEDLQAVLAHELNHIRRKDCLSTLCAELVRVLHFYHPLMHWLANRLRLEQELAADAHAAHVLGGQKRYLCILAEMALSESARPPAWPARAFLPSHRTLIRRIEMLRKNPMNDGRASRFWRFATMTCLALATVFAVGLRDRPSTATAQEPDPTNPIVVAQADPLGADGGGSAESQPFPLTYVPDDAIAVFGIRPKELLSKPSLKPLVQILMKSDETAKPFGIPLDEVEQIVWSLGAEDTPRHPPMLIAGMVRTSGKLSLESLKEQLLSQPDTGFYGGQLYLRNKNGSGKAFWLANEHTLVISDTENGLKQAIDARNLSVNRQKRIHVWDQVANRVFASYANVGILRRLMDGGDPGMAPGGFPGAGGFGRAPQTPQRAFQKSMGLNPMFAPLWNDVEIVVGGVSCDNDIQAKFSVITKDVPDGATKVKQTLDAILVLGRNMVEQNQQMIGQLPQREREMVGTLLEIGQEVIQTIQIQQTRNNVVVAAKLSPKSVNQLVSALVPAVTAAQDAARTAQAKNNLKQIGIAMHNFHDVHNEFPKPVMMGPDGKTPHSWRVAILPYIEESALYEQYHFDEPWDSEHNKKLVEKMPAVYRHPKDKANSTNASYFALTGKNTLLGDSKRTASFRDVTDGTSNTIMIVEAKRDIPWTKPEDIPYDGDHSKPLPKLGGWFKEGFVAGFGDGAVHFLKQTIDKTTLQHLIERNDGHPVNFNDFTDRPQRRVRPGAIPEAPVIRGGTDEGAAEFGEESSEGGGAAPAGGDRAGGVARPE